MINGLLGLKILFDWRKIEKKNGVRRSDLIFFFFLGLVFHIPEHVYVTHTNKWYKCTSSLFL